MVGVTKTGCSSYKSDTANISIFPLPDTSIQRIGNLLISSATGHYQWYRNDTLLLNDTMQTHSINNLCGSYKVEITDDNNCKAMSEKYDTSCNVGISSIISNAILISIYPNPLFSSAIIEISNSNYKNCDLFIYDVLGQEVLKKKIVNQKTEIEKRNLPSGIYFYQLKNEKKFLANGKLVIND